MLNNSQLFKKNLARLFLFFALIIISDQIIGLLLRYLYFNQKTGQQQALTYILTENRSEILILGNSRAQHHYVPSILSDSLNMSCYNGGLDGGHSILLPYGQIKVIINHYSPKLLILEYDPTDYAYNYGDYERLSVFLPYVKEYPDLYKLVLHRSQYEKLKLISAIYPFNSNIISMIRFNTSFVQKININGYVPIFNRQLDSTTYNTFHTKYAQISRVNLTPDSIKLDALKQIIELCKEKGIRLVLVNSPYFNPDSNNHILRTDYYKNSIDFILQEQIEFYDFKFDHGFEGRMDLFADVSHLNDSGARIFTSCLAEKLNKKGYNQNSQ
jgi:hypothetical protein